MGLGILTGTSIPEARAQGQAPLEIFLIGFTYDEAAAKYYAVVSITDPSRVGDLDPQILDLQTGESASWGSLIRVDKAEVDFTLPTDQLQPGRKYRLAIRALQRGASTPTWLRRVSQNPSENPLVFASQEFSYNPPSLAPIVFSVDGVNPDFLNRTLQIAVHHSDTSKILRYEAVVINKKGGAVGRIDRAPLTLRNGVVEAPLPVAMEREGQPVEYHLTFRLYTADNKLVGESGKDFTAPAPPVPNIVERVTVALDTNPWLGWSLGGIAACLVLLYLFQTFVPHRRKPLPRPQNLQPIFLQSSPTSSPSLVASPLPAYSPPPVPSPAPPAAAALRPTPLPAPAVPPQPAPAPLLEWTVAHPGPGVQPPASAEQRSASPRPSGVIEAGLVLIIGGVEHRMAAGVKLEPQIFGADGAGRGRAPIAEVTTNPENAAILGLRNLSSSPWTVSRPRGQPLVIEEGRSVRLDDGITIDFGGIEGRVQAQ